MKLRKLSLAAGLSLLAVGLLGTAGPDQPASATDIMTKACDSFKEVNSVKLRGLVTVDNFRGNQKFQNNVVVDVLAKRPDKFKAITQGDRIGGIVFDGTMISVFDSAKNFYAQVERKGDFRTFLDSSEELNVPTPMLDFFVASNCHEAIKKVTDSEVLPELVLDGVKVSHLVFTNATDKINWEAWVAMTEDRYIIKKVVITSMHLKEQPQYSFLLISESLNAEIADAEFEFTPGADAKKIEFLELMNRRGPPSEEENPGGDTGGGSEQPGQDPENPGQDPDEPGQDPENPGQDPDEPVVTTTTQAPTTTTQAPTTTTQAPATTTTQAPTTTTSGKPAGRN